MIVSGPMFQPSRDEFRESCSGNDGGHYNVFRMRSEALGLRFLRRLFPRGEADDLDFVLFSTSGVHGSYATLEEVLCGVTKYPFGFGPDDEWPEDYHGDTITFLLVEPRIVSMTYGNAKIQPEDGPFLFKLRESSWAAVRRIGAAPEPGGLP
jgi:hypothetical protein